MVKNQMAPVESYPEWSDKEQRSLFAFETQLQKTKLCTYHLKGRCKHSTACRFAHGTEELVVPPNLHKTKMCPMVLANKQCKNHECTFAHHERELKKVNVCHKTVVCSWFLAGMCRNGSDCSFAHGDHELKGSKPQEQKLEPHAVRKNVKRQQNELIFVQPEPLSRQTSVALPVPPKCGPQYMPPENSLFSEPCPFTPPQQQLSSVPPPPPLPCVPPPPPPGVPNFVNGMQPYVGQCPAPPQREVLSMQFNYMSMPPTPAMPPFADVEVSSGTPVQCEREHISMKEVEESSLNSMELCQEISSQADTSTELPTQNADLGRNFVGSPLSKGGVSSRMVVAKGRSRSLDVPRRESDDNACLNLPGYAIKNTFINTINDVDIDFMAMDNMMNTFENIRVLSPETYASSGMEPVSSETGTMEWLSDHAANRWDSDGSDGVRPCGGEWGNAIQDHSKVSNEGCGQIPKSGVPTPEVPLPDSGTVSGYGPPQQPFMNFQVANTPTPTGRPAAPPTAASPLPHFNLNPGMVERVVFVGGDNLQYAAHFEISQDITGPNSCGFPRLPDGCNWAFDDSAQMPQDPGPSVVRGHFVPVSTLPTAHANQHVLPHSQQPQQHQLGMYDMMGQKSCRRERTTPTAWSDPISPKSPCRSRMQVPSWEQQASWGPPQGPPQWDTGKSTPGHSMKQRSKPPQK